MKIVIVGSSGFVGTELRSFFEGQGHEVVGLKVRDESRIDELSSELDSADVLINLAGVSIFGRWTQRYKDSLYSSRINTTQKLVEAMKACDNRPKRFISTSAVGIYPNDISCDETHTDLSQSYLAKICKDWEEEAFKAGELGVATTVLRSGVVLGRNGGMLQKLRLPFSLGLGGRVGSGKQALSWIHIKDLCGVYQKIIQDSNLVGVYNLCAPQSTTNIEMTKVLGSVLHRPTLFPVPAWILRLVFAEGAALMLEGQNAYPKHLLDKGFEFEYTNISDALNDLLKTPDV